MKHRLSIRDIARDLGVSHTTVSLALRNSPRISPKLRLRVHRAARQMDYRMDTVVSTLMARLRMLRARDVQESIGLLTAWPTRNDWHAEPNLRRFSEGLRRRALELGYGLDELWLKEPGMTGSRMTRIIRARGIRGLVLQSLPDVGGRLSLDWRHFACVTKGLTVQYPPVHRIVSSHYEDMHLVLSELDRRRYRRIGLVLSESLSARVDRAWLAAFLLHQADAPSRHRVPALIMRTARGQEGFTEWYATQRPEVILFSEQPIPLWVGQLGLKVPRDIGLVHLDWSSDVANLAGFDSDPEEVGSAAIDLLVGQMQANEFGIPKHEKIIAVRGHWVPGPSIRDP